MVLVDDAVVVVVGDGRVDDAGDGVVRVGGYVDGACGDCVVDSDVGVVGVSGVVDVDGVGDVVGVDGVGVGDVGVGVDADVVVDIDGGNVRFGVVYAIGAGVVWCY